MSLGTVAGNLLWCSVLALLLLSGCAVPERTIDPEVDSPFYAESEDEGNAESDVPDEILTSIQRRNRGLEDDPEWLNDAVKQIMLKYIRKIPEDQYSEYAKFVDGGKVYIIVHPAYYVFFHGDEGGTEPYETDNVVERFITEPATEPGMLVIQHQEKVMRDFLEYMSTQKKLIILVLPGRYKTYKRYRFRKQADEFARYINEVTNGSESVIYLYSKRANTGRVYDKDLNRLLNFLSRAGAREIYLGGGYFERCLEGFYKKLLRYTSREVYLVPELIQLSPKDMGYFLSRRFLQSDGSLDINEFTDYIEGKLEEKRGRKVSGVRNLGVNAR